VLRTFNAFLSHPPSSFMIHLIMDHYLDRPEYWRVRQVLQVCRENWQLPVSGKTYAFAIEAMLRLPADANPLEEAMRVYDDSKHMEEPLSIDTHLRLFDFAMGEYEDLRASLLETISPSTAEVASKEGDGTRDDTPANNINKGETGNDDVDAPLPWDDPAVRAMRAAGRIKSRFVWECGDAERGCGLGLHALWSLAWLQCRMQHDIPQHHWSEIDPTLVHPPPQPYLQPPSPSSPAPPWQSLVQQGIRNATHTAGFSTSTPERFVTMLKHGDLPDADENECAAVLAEAQVVLGRFFPLRPTKEKA